MSGLTHTTNQTRFFGMKLERQLLPTIWPLKRSKPDRVETGLQIYTQDEPLPPSKRLVVFLPDENFDIFTLPQLIWNLAAPDYRQVLLLTKPLRQENEFHTRLNLITLAALIRDPRVVVQTQLVLGMSLDQAACEYSLPDDVIVCFEDQLVPGFLKKVRLGDDLAQKTHLPVYIINREVSEKANPFSERLIDFLLLAICLATLVGFFALEVWIDQNSAGGFHTVLQILAVFVEVWIVAACVNRSFKI